MQLNGLNCSIALNEDKTIDIQTLNGQTSFSIESVLYVTNSMPSNSKPAMLRIVLQNKETHLLEYTDEQKKDFEEMFAVLERICLHNAKAAAQKNLEFEVCTLPSLYTTNEEGTSFSIETTISITNKSLRIMFPAQNGLKVLSLSDVLDINLELESLRSNSKGETITLTGEYALFYLNQNDRYKFNRINVNYVQKEEEKTLCLSGEKITQAYEALLDGFRAYRLTHPCDVPLLTAQGLDPKGKPIFHSHGNIALPVLNNPSKYKAILITDTNSEPLIEEGRVVLTYTNRILTNRDIVAINHMGKGIVFAHFLRINGKAHIYVSTPEERHPITPDMQIFATIERIFDANKIRQMPEALSHYYKKPDLQTLPTTETDSVPEDVSLQMPAEDKQEPIPEIQQEQIDTVPVEQETAEEETIKKPEPINTAIFLQKPVQEAILAKQQAEMENLQHNCISNDFAEDNTQCAEEPIVEKDNDDTAVYTPPVNDMPEEQEVIQTAQVSEGIEKIYPTEAEEKATEQDILEKQYVEPTGAQVPEPEQDGFFDKYEEDTIFDKPKKTGKVPIIILSILLALAIAACGFLYIITSNKIDVLETERQQLEDELNTQQGASQSLIDQADFFDNHAALILTQTDNKEYHTFNCSDFFASEGNYKIMTVEQAEKAGYKPCPKCH